MKCVVWRFFIVPMLLGLTSSMSFAQTPPPWRLEHSWLWLDPAPPEEIGRAGVMLRGFNNGNRYRPGLEFVPKGFDSSPHALPVGTTALRIHLSNDISAGFLMRSNFDKDELAAVVPNIAVWLDRLAARYRKYTGTDELAGNQGLYFNKFKGEASGSYQPWNLRYYFEAIDQREAKTYLGALDDESSSRPRYTLNLTWSPTPRSTVSAGLRYDGIFVNNYELTAWDFPSASLHRRIDEISTVLSGRTQLNSQNELSLTYDLSYYREDKSAQNGLSTPGHDNLDTYEYWGNYPWTTRRRQAQHYLDLHWSSFRDGLLAPGDAHTFTLGIQIENNTRDDDLSRNGGFTFIDGCKTETVKNAQGVDVEQCMLVDEGDRNSWVYGSSDRGDELHAKTEQTNLAVYLEDKLQFGSRITLTPGLRFEYFSAGFQNTSALWQTVTFSPRIGAEYLITRSGSFKAFGSFGRHYQNLDYSMYIRAREGAAYSPLEYWDWGGDVNPQNYSLDPGKNDPRWSRAERFPALTGGIDPNLKHPYMDRFVVGLMTLFEDIAFEGSLRYEYRRQRDLLAIFDSSASIYNETTNPNGSYTVSQRIDNNLADPQPYQYYNLRKEARQEFVIGNPEGAYRDTHSVQLKFREDFTSWLTLKGDLTWTWDQGNLNALSGLSTEWRDPNGRINADGPMPGFDDWKLHFELSADLPYEFLTYIDYTFYSGEHHDRYYRVKPDNGPRTYIYDARGRGGYTYPSQYVVDLRLQRPLPIPGSGQWTAWFEATNLFNSSKIVSVKEQSSIFYRVVKIQRPLEMHLGVRYEY